MSTLPNWRALDSGRYMVRTQAGLKQALKHWLVLHDYQYDIRRQDFRGYPKQYPAVVWFSWDYHRSNSKDVFWLSLNDYADRLRADLADLEPDLSMPGTVTDSA